MRTIQKLVLCVFIMMLTTGLASATAQLTVDELEKEVPLGGTVDFTITVLDSEAQPAAALGWHTYDPLITANIPGSGTLTQNGAYTPIAIVANTPTAFTLKVAADPNAVLNNKVRVKVLYFNTELDLEALVTAAVIPTPELPTSALMSVGLIGLFGMVYLRRKN